MYDYDKINTIMIIHNNNIGIDSELSDHGRLWLCRESRLSTKQKVGGLIPRATGPHVLGPDTQPINWPWRLLQPSENDVLESSTYIESDVLMCVWVCECVNVTCSLKAPWVVVKTWKVLWNTVHLPFNNRAGCFTSSREMLVCILQTGVMLNVMFSSAFVCEWAEWQTFWFRIRGRNHDLLLNCE